MSDDRDTFPNFDWQTIASLPANAELIEVKRLWGVRKYDADGSVIVDDIVIELTYRVPREDA